MTKRNIPTLAVAELSTAHMSLKDNELLRSYAQNPQSRHFPTVARDVLGRVIPHEYGYFVSLAYNPDTCTTQASWGRALRLVGFSSTFVIVCRVCKKAKFSWIYFDRDAESVDGLPTEAW